MTVYILVYVDDVLLTGTRSKFIQDLVADFNKEFALKQLGELSYFLRLESHKTKEGLMLCHTKYLCFGFFGHDKNGRSTPLFYPNGCWNKIIWWRQ